MSFVVHSIVSARGVGHDREYLVSYEGHSHTANTVSFERREDQFLTP